MLVRVVPFARIREILGGERDSDVGAEATAGDVFDVLAREYPALAALRTSTRFVRNGSFVNADTALDGGDELGLLPPYGGG